MSYFVLTRPAAYPIRKSTARKCGRQVSIGPGVSVLVPYIQGRMDTSMPLSCSQDGKKLLYSSLDPVTETGLYL